MSTTDTSKIPNSLEEHWMPFTSNRDFKENPRLITEAKGVYLKNHQGKTMIDASSGLFCNPLGHGRKEITNAVTKQLEQLDYVQPFQQGFGGSFELARRIAKHTPGNLNRIFYTICGSTAVETAIKIVIALAASPVLGFFGGLLLMHIVYWSFRRTAYSTVNGIFGRLQILSAGWAAYAHGKNDGQNAAGIITFAVAVHAGTMAADVSVPFWAIGLSALTIGLGTALGGWKVIQTLGMKVTKLTHVHGFSSGVAAGSVIEFASLIGLPVSTTHTMTGAVMGVGSTERLSAVRWGVTRRIISAWVISYPVCFVIGYLMVKGFDLVI